MEINEVVDYLRDPSRYLRAGAIGSREALLPCLGCWWQQAPGAVSSDGGAG
jgi:hypothetical protein